MSNDERANGSWPTKATALHLTRRTVLRGGLAAFATAMMSRTLSACSSPSPVMNMDAGPLDAGPTFFPVREIPATAPIRSLIAEIGELGDADANGVRLPAGFTSRIIARAGQNVEGTSYAWHLLPDGGATFATEDGGWIYVSNSEVPAIGGVSAIRFEASGSIRSAYRILDRSSVNCAGGRTPWHSWLSCEEIDRGRVIETDPWGEHAAIVRNALGCFKHEAAAIDSVRGHVYLTEDQPDGRFYRFVPDRMLADGRPDLSSGQLQVAVVGADDVVAWHAILDPEFAGAVPTRMQVPEATIFSGNEGVWYHEDRVYFSSKGDNHVRVYDAVSGVLSVLYDGSDTRLRGVDNLTVTCCGDVFVAEDQGSMQLVAILSSGELKPLLQVVGSDSSEITGPAFDPSGTRLYFSSQRGDSNGITYEITGPFHAPA